MSPLREGESQAGPLHRRLVRAEALERSEEPVELIGRDPVAGIGHPDPQPISLDACARDRHRAAFPVVLHGVGQEVEENLGESLPVGEDVDITAGGGRIERDRAAAGER